MWSQFSLYRTAHRARRTESKAWQLRPLFGLLFLYAMLYAYIHANNKPYTWFEDELDFYVSRKQHLNMVLMALSQSTGSKTNLDE